MGGPGWRQGRWGDYRGGGVTVLLCWRGRGWAGKKQVCVSVGGTQIHSEVSWAEAWCQGWHEEVHGAPAATLLVASLIVTSPSSSATNPMIQSGIIPSPRWDASQALLQLGVACVHSSDQCELSWHRFWKVLLSVQEKRDSVGTSPFLPAM